MPSGMQGTAAATAASEGTALGAPGGIDDVREAGEGTARLESGLETPREPDESAPESSPEPEPDTLPLPMSLSDADRRED